jgi:hypothetical protein
VVHRLRHGYTKNVARKLLHIYLQDHLAGAVAGLELVKRSKSSNEGTPLGAFLGRLESDIRADRDALEDVMDRVGAPRRRLKTAAAWVAEKVGRLKLNGRLVGYSDLSRLLEIEGLCVGVEAKASLWRSLKTSLENDPVLDSVHLDELIARAEQQRQDLEEHRIEAASTAFDH